jgi:hypothetical protein
LLQEIIDLINLLKTESIDKIGPLLLEYRNYPALAALIDSLSKK